MRFSVNKCSAGIYPYSDHLLYHPLHSRHKGHKGLLLKIAVLSVLGALAVQDLFSPQRRRGHREKQLLTLNVPDPDPDSDFDPEKTDVKVTTALIKNS
ncbi:MAG: hypothetical protein JRE12_04630 [Deltaproteobacteria bacterium]|nr:hypothetical protein [Deltaproteobacteria bacterium]